MVETSLSMRSFYAVLDVLLKNKKPCRIKTICKGFSMAPLINNNDSVIISPVTCTIKLAVGTIAVIAYPKREKVIVHRIIRTKGQLYLTKGDNISTPDGWVKKEQIVGIVETVLKQSFSYKCHLSINFIIALISRAGIFTFFNKWVSHISRLRRRILGTL